MTTIWGVPPISKPWFINPGLTLVAYDCISQWPPPGVASGGRGNGTSEDGRELPQAGRCDGATELWHAEKNDGLMACNGRV